jgi:branched-chain amino acid transport system substrate-binding protein
MNEWRDRMWLILLAVLGAALTLCGCSKETDSGSGTGSAGGRGDIIKVGEFASLTGKEATFGQMSHRGTQLAIEEVNAAGGVLGNKVELIYEDDQSKAGEPATVVKKLISRDRVIAVLGEVASSRSMEAAPICQQNKIPMISPSSTNVKLTEMGDYIFRVCFTDEFQGKLLANFAKRTLKAMKIAIMTDVKSDYSVGLSRDFKMPFTAAGGSIVAEQTYNGGDKDFKGQLTAIKAANPDAIIVTGYYTDVGLIVKEARQLGITVPLFGGDGWESSKLIEIGGADVEGTYFSTHFSPEAKSPAVEAFVRKFREKYRELPDAMAALGYDSAMVLIEAIKRAGAVEGPKLRDAIAATKDHPGITGTITLDEKRNAPKAAVILTVKDGKFKFVETVTP